MKLDRVWVIGGTSGIGAAVVTRIMHDQETYSTGTEIDVRHHHQIRGFVRQCGPFEGIVYSAGITALDWSKEIDTLRMVDIYNVNVIGLVRVLQACPPGVLKRVVVIGSDAARRPMRTSLAYCASKAALDMAVKVIARERASENFAINIVSPGMTDDTGMTDYIDQRVPEVRGWDPDKAARYERSQTPLGRRATPQEIAEVVANTLYTDTPYLNGAIIEVNGGR